MSRRLSVVSITESLRFGGDEQRLFQFACGIDREKIDHRVIVLGQEGEQDAAVEKLYRAASIPMTFLGWTGRSFGENGDRSQPSIGDALRYRSKIIQLRGVLQGIAPDVLDLRKHFAIVLGGIAGRWAGVPVITGIDYHASLLASRKRRLPMTWGLRLLDAFISDARATIDGYSAVFSNMPSKGVVIQNGIPRPATTRSRAEMLTMFGLDPTSRRPVIGQVATLVPFKGQDTLLSAIRILVDAGMDADFLMIGFVRSPDYVEMLRQQILSSGYDGHVALKSYHGPSEDIWAAIDIHAHAARMDSSPIAIHESMALGLPLASTDVGGIAELVTSEQTGLLVRPDDPRALAEALARLLTDADFARRLGSAARRRFDERHSVALMVDKTIDLYERLLAQKSRKPDRRLAA